MTQDEIIKMARQAGLWPAVTDTFSKELEAFAKLVFDWAYIAPCTWVGLTDEEIAECAERMEASDPTDSFWREFERAIEAKLKEKNT